MAPPKRSMIPEDIRKAILNADQVVVRVDSLENEGKTNKELLIRIDERLKALAEDVKALGESFVPKAEFEKQIARLKGEIEPIKKFVWGAFGLAGTALGGAIIGLVIRQ